jgi:hypothetical protein
MEQRCILARFRYKGQTIYVENVPALTHRSTNALRKSPGNGSGFRELSPFLSRNLTWLSLDDDKASLTSVNTRLPPCGEGKRRDNRQVAHAAQRQATALMHGTSVRQGP